MRQSEFDLLDQIKDENATKDQQLIPWENNYGISRNLGDALIIQQEKLKEDIKQLNEQLNFLKTGGKRRQRWRERV